MFGPAGHAYVYLVYGMHHCLNVVTGAEGEAGAVLIRAVEPLIGMDRMQIALDEVRARSRRRRPAAGTVVPIAGAAERLAAGPGRLTASFGIDLTHNDVDLCAAGSPVRLEQPPVPDPRAIARSPRIGVGYAGEPWSSIQWRFFLTPSGSTSGSRSSEREAV